MAKTIINAKNVPDLEELKMFLTMMSSAID